MSEIFRTGIWITVNRMQHCGPSDVPPGRYSLVITANDAWFAVDMAGNVRGNPEAVEREAFSLSNLADCWEAHAAIGLARLARHRLKQQVAA